jgi:hypothetical protein
LPSAISSPTPITCRNAGRMPCFWRTMCGERSQGARVLLYAARPWIDEFPEELFVDDD